MSVITQEMIDAFAVKFEVSPEAAQGSLAMWESGQGELDESLVGAELFAPLREAYFAAHSVENPPVSNLEEPAVEPLEEVTEDSKLPVDEVKAE